MNGSGSIFMTIFVTLLIISVLLNYETKKCDGYVVFAKTGFACIAINQK